jgi:hypothetical protein
VVECVGRKIGSSQGDQIGQLFTHFILLTYLGQFLDKYRNSTTFWVPFIHGTSYVLNLTKNGLGYIFSQTQLVTLVPIYCVSSLSATGTKKGSEQRDQMSL